MLPGDLEVQGSTEFGFVRPARRRNAVRLSRCCTVAVRRKALIDGALVIEFKIGSGTGTRTLNLAVNRSPQPVQNSRGEFAGCRRVSPNITVCHRRCRTPNRRLTKGTDSKDAPMAPKSTPCGPLR